MRPWAAVTTPRNESAVVSGLAAMAGKVGRPSARPVCAECHDVTIGTPTLRQFTPAIDFLSLGQGKGGQRAEE